MAGQMRIAAWRPAVRAVGTNTLASGLAALVALVGNVLISRQLGPSARGEVAFVLQLSYLVMPFLLLGVDRQNLRSDSRQDNTRPTRHLVPVTAFVTVVLLGFFQDWRALAPVIALTLSWLAIRRSQSLRDHSFAHYVRAFVTYQVFVAGCTILLFLSGNDDWHWWLLPYALPSVIVLFTETGKNWRVRPREIFGHVNKASLQLLPSTIATLVVMRGDRLLMPALASNTQLGLYAAVATATEMIYWVAQSLADHRVSRLSSRRSIPALVRSLVVDAMMFALVATLVAALIFAILLPLLGPQFASARALVLPLSMAAVVLAIYRQFIAWHLGGPRPETVSFIEVTTAFFALPCYWFAILSGGAQGAAWSSLGVYGFGVTLSLITALRQRKRLE